jgi:hypothetical protein
VADVPRSKDLVEGIDVTIPSGDPLSTEDGLDPGVFHLVRLLSL